MPPVHTSGEKRPLRIFRADAPQEVASASIVAGALKPGRNVLAIYGGGSYGSPEEAVANLRAMAAAYPWDEIVDLTDLPVKEVTGPENSLRQRLKRTQATVATVRGTRERLAEALEVTASEVPPAIDEVYVSVLTAGTMVTAYVLSPTASICCYPHTFMSVSGLERYRLVAPSTPAGRLADLGKSLIWGQDAVPTREISIDLAVTFWREPPWAQRTISLAHLVTRESMERLFAALPSAARGYFERLATECGAATAILLLAPGDRARHSERQPETELAAYTRLVARLADRQQARSILVKPHPRMRPARVEEVTSALRARFPALRFAVPSAHATLPVEVIAAPFSLVGCAAIISTSIATLPAIYAVRGYYDAPAATSLYGDGVARELISEWNERIPGRLEST